MSAVMAEGRRVEGNIERVAVLFRNKTASSHHICATLRLICRDTGRRIETGSSCFLSLPREAVPSAAAAADKRVIVGPRTDSREGWPALPTAFAIPALAFDTTCFARAVNAYRGERAGPTMHHSYGARLIELVGGVVE